MQDSARANIIAPLRPTLDRTHRLIKQLRASPIQTVEYPPDEINLYTMLASQATISIAAGFLGFILAVGHLYQLPALDPTTGLLNAAAFGWTNVYLIGLVLSFLVYTPLWLATLTGVLAAVDLYAKDSPLDMTTWSEKYIRYGTALIPYALLAPLTAPFFGLLGLLGTATSWYLVDRALHPSLTLEERVEIDPTFYNETLCNGRTADEVVARRATWVIFALLLLMSIIDVASRLPLAAWQ